ncbi:MAG TPA: hypothetical protein VMB51_00270 [Solirubrobacteraceae bacterium]|nr:hypothetical protein [Solirubrobacteraceae bacterium]
MLLVLIDLSAVSQTLMLIFLANLFGAVGHGGPWLPAVLISIAVTAALIWFTTVVWRAITRLS